MEEKIELKPCPFCGNANVKLTTAAEIEEIEEDDENYECESENYTVICTISSGGCGAVSGYAQNEETAARKWNRRAKHEKI